MPSNKYYARISHFLTRLLKQQKSCEIYMGKLIKHLGIGSPWSEKLYLVISP